MYNILYFQSPKSLPSRSHTRIPQMRRVLSLLRITLDGNKNILPFRELCQLSPLCVILLTTCKCTGASHFHNLSRQLSKNLFGAFLNKVLSKRFRVRSLSDPMGTDLTLAFCVSFFSFFLLFLFQTVSLLIFFIQINLTFPFSFAVCRSYFWYFDHISSMLTIFLVC